MQHNRTFTYLAGAAVLAAVVMGFGVSLAALLPFSLLLVACPLMMFLMMRGMSGAHSSEGPPATGPRNQPPDSAR